MLTPFSQLELAYRDTSILRASGGAFDKLSQVFGFPRPDAIPEQQFRAALYAVAYGARGCPAPMHDVLEALFGWFGEEVTGTVGGALLPHVVESAAATYGCSSAGHYVRVTESDGTSNIYYAYASNNNDELELAEIGTSYWKAASFTGLSDPVTVRFLPYIIEEHDGVLLIYLDGGIFQQPSSYAQEDGSVDRTVVAPTQPYGGQIIKDGTTSNEQMHDVAWAVAAEPKPAPTATGLGYPLYLGGTELKGQIQALLKSIVPAGVHVRILFHEWCNESVLARLVINEIDYDNVGGDGFEFVEVYNAGLGPKDLTNVVLSYYNGFGILDTAYVLNIGDGVMLPGDRLVVGTAAIVAGLPGGTKSITISDSTMNNLAAGFTLEDGATRLDGVAWESGGVAYTDGVTNQTAEVWMASIYEGTMLAPDAGTANSWQRTGGVDTNDNAADFHLALPQPGLPNI